MAGEKEDRLPSQQLPAATQPGSRAEGRERRESRTNDDDGKDRKWGRGEDREVSESTNERAVRICM